MLHSFFSTSARVVSQVSKIRTESLSILAYSLKKLGVLTSLVSLFADFTDDLSLLPETRRSGTTSADTDIPRLSGKPGLKLSSPLEEVRPSPIKDVAFMDNRFWIRDDPEPGPMKK